MLQRGLGSFEGLFSILPWAYPRSQLSYLIKKDNGSQCPCLHALLSKHLRKYKLLFQIMFASKNGSHLQIFSYSNADCPHSLRGARGRGSIPSFIEGQAWEGCKCMSQRLDAITEDKGASNRILLINYKPTVYKLGHRLCFCLVYNNNSIWMSLWPKDLVTCYVFAACISNVGRTSVIPVLHWKGKSLVC